MITLRQFKDLLAEVDAAGTCSHPIRLRGTTRDALTGEVRSRTVKVPCKDRRAVLCPSCSALYQGDAFVLVAVGLNGGKGVPEQVAARPRCFVTLTAPSFGAVHSGGMGAACRPRRRRERCVHGVATWCSAVHNEHDEVLGAPLCEECLDVRGAVLWNAMASSLWDRTIVRLRRTLAGYAGLPATSLGRVARVEFVKVAEIQRRGLVHVHAIVRADGPDGALSEPPDWLSTEQLEASIVASARSTQVVDPVGTTHRWGDQLDVSAIAAIDADDRRVASYLAKYATKSTDGTVSLARRFEARHEIEHVRVPEHLRRLALMAWDLEDEPEFEELGLRRHAHALGFRGQLVTKSRGYSTTFASLRGARARYRARASGSNPVEGTFGFVGRGYDHPLAAPWAEDAAKAKAEWRKEAARRRRKSREGDE